LLKYWTKNGHCVFEGLGATYTVYLRHIGKLLVDFLFVVIELFFARCYI